MWRCGSWLRTGMLAAGIMAGGAAHAGPWTSLYIFGDSLSDSGNNTFIFDNVIGPTIPVPPGTLRTPVPIANDGFIPDFTYASGRYTNQSFVWADAFAAALGLTNAASLTDDADLDTVREAGLAPGGSAEHAVTHMSESELRELRRLLKEELTRPGA